MINDTTRRLPANTLVHGDEMNKLIAHVRSSAVMPSPGQAIVNGTGGTSILPIGNPLLAPAITVTESDAPFTIYDASSGATLKLGVTSGTVNGVVPTLGGTALDNATPPTLTVTATRYLWLKCVGTFGSPDTYAVTVEDSATSATPAGTAISGTAFTSFLSIGYATVASGAITGIYPTNNANWNAESFGSTNIWWK